MCMLYMTPHRAYRAKVLNDMLSGFARITHKKLAEVLFTEVTENAYADNTIWHPAFAELLAFAALHADTLGHLCKNMRQQNYDYPLCDIIEGIADLFDCLGQGGFNTTTQALAARQHKVQENTYIQDADLTLCWAWLHRAQLPHAAILLAPMFEAHKSFITGYVARIQLSVLLNCLNGYRKDLGRQMTQNKAISQATGHRLHTQVLGFLENGYSLTECRNHLTITQPMPIVRRSWRKAWQFWSTDPMLPLLENLPDAGHVFSRIPNLPNPSQRSKTLVRNVRRLLEHPVNGPTILLWVMPNTVDNLPFRMTTDTQLRKISEADSLIRRMKNRIRRISSEDLPSLVQEVQTFLGHTETLSVAT